jgi:hypothetical protein
MVLVALLRATIGLRIRAGKIALSLVSGRL